MTNPAVMAGLDPAIHVFLCLSDAWMPGSSPGTTTERRRALYINFTQHPPADSSAADVTSDPIFKQPGYTLAFSRRDRRPSLVKPCPSRDRGRREDRVPATAPTAPAQRRLRERALTTGERGNHSGLPCAVALRLIRTLLGEPFRLPPSSARCASIVANLAPDVGAPGPHDFAVRERAARRTASQRPPHPSPRP
jgi:hypothetical protein